jgi:GntR family transcriptional regulator
MWITVDPRSEVPLYQQIVDRVREGVARGWFKPGDKMPSVRELAIQLTLNHNTVAKAYQELERIGVIETLRGKGTFIANPAVKKGNERDYAYLRERIEQLLIDCYYLGIPPEAVVKEMKEAVEKWKRKEL